MKDHLNLLLPAALLFMTCTVHSFDTATLKQFIIDVQQMYVAGKNLLEDGTSTPDAVTRKCSSLEAAVLNIKRVRLHLSLTEPYSEAQLQAILANLCEMERIVGLLIDRMRYLIPYLVEEIRYKAPFADTAGSVGRPSYIIIKEQLETLRRYSFSWIEVAKLLGVSVSTIWRRRVQLGVETRNVRRRKRITRAELRETIAFLQETNPEVGIIMIEGHLQANGMYSSRLEISEVLLEINPLGGVLRWNKQIPRVQYKVAGPNSLWHIDGNHKLIRWKLVIHGGIDGYSRVVVFLHCSSNNRADTVAKLFLDATKEFCWPSRVRTDKGGENADVASLMLERRGEGRGSIIQGSSVHNQRIERLWRDTRTAVVEYYRMLFYFMEENQILDIENDRDVFALHYVYIPRINNSLNKFKSMWNNHKLSSENQKTPLQLYISGMLRLFGSEHTAVKDFFEPGQVEEEEYGVISPEASELSQEDSRDNEVTIPEVRPNISPACLAEITRNIRPLDQDGNHGINHFTQTREIMGQN